MAMARYEPFCEQRLSNLALIWMENRLSSIRIMMGPLAIHGEFDIYNSVIRLIATEAGQVVPGSLRWYDSKYLVCRCLYGFLRLHGVMNWDWEMPNEYVDFDLSLFDELVTPYKPHLRAKYPTHLNRPLCVENLWTNSYMKIIPSFHPKRATPVYPAGDTTAWVDSILNQDPSFNSDLIPATIHERVEAVA